jgi:hypothetical protein
VVLTLLPSFTAAQQHVRLGKSVPDAARIASRLAPPVIVGMIADLSGRVVVLDGGASELTLLAREGRQLLHKLVPNGRRIFGDPKSIAFEDNHGLFVLDARPARLLRFQLRDNQIEFISSIPLAGIFAVSGACAIGGKYFVIGITAPAEKSQLIHVVTSEGTVERSFGKPFGSTQFERLVFSESRILCDRAGRTITVSSRSYPEVRTYDTAGRLKWSANIPGFQHVAVVQTSPRRMQYRWPTDSLWDKTVSMFYTASDVIAVQVGRRRGRDVRNGYVGFRTVLFRTTTGRSLGKQEDLPLILATSRTHAYAVGPREDSLLVYPLSISGRP